jgi:hypothetical protein
MTTCGCQTGETCDPLTNQCCIPNGTCNGCNNNCGVPSSLCCPALDGGLDGGDGGTCLLTGAACLSSAQCCSDVCGPGPVFSPDSGTTPMVCQ